ncbi:PQQ-like beta-propeller repeat protein, partial [Planctomicrobium sp.]|nr:PQQ-like beta-propeller repeat protein [Planctomicrobium sp.]
MMIGPAFCGLVYSILLLFHSRIGSRDGAKILVVNAILAVFVGITAAHRSGIGTWLFGVPSSLVLCTLALTAARARLSETYVRDAIIATSGVWVLLAMTRIDGIDGSYSPEFSWRWSPTSEERLLSELSVKIEIETVSIKWLPTELGWSGFRGPHRDSRYVDTLTKQDWNVRPPIELWRRPVGPGWSSMAVVSDRLFTQEQRGEVEATTCYDAKTGEPIWTHNENSRFEEVVSGAGPRATPTIFGDQVFAFGANGVLVALNGHDGSLIWRRDMMKEYGASLPVWGFSASPLVYKNLVVVFAGGKGDKGLIALSRETGEEIWSVASTSMNFGSAHLMDFHSEQQIVFVEPGFVRGLEIDTGNDIWRADVIDGRDFPMIQPQQIDESSLIVATGDGKGVVRLDIEKKGAWSVQKNWQSRTLKPSFNDFLYLNGFMYGFDKQIFACIDASTGERRWKNGRFGFGQAILLESTAQLIVASEFGELVLLDADPKKFTERGRVAAMSSKTWNHPALDSGRLYVRNSEEMV